jgi:hypothetical protein
MKTQKARLEEAEQAKGKKAFYTIEQVLDFKNFNNEDLYKYKDEEKLLTLEEARERFKDGDLLYITYTDNWNKYKPDREDLI